MTENSLERIQPWRERWLSGQTGWDQGQAHSEMGRLLHQARLEGRLPAAARIFSAGCGRAHHEAWMAGQGYLVDAVDAVPEAITAARILYEGIPGLNLQVADVFASTLSSPAYDAVFDRAMLCAVQPQDRLPYVQKLWEMLRPDGLVMAILFRRTHKPEGPPFALAEDAAMELFQPRFDLVHVSSCPPPPNQQNVLEEWLCIWRKRSL